MVSNMTCGECQLAEERHMPDYKTMYYQLAAKVADAVELLISAQQQGELQFVERIDDSEMDLPEKRKDMVEEEN